ncbi:MAG: single-stranded DNA-binding protein [Prevotellaceae bacterium]|jgi:single-strand DNA-binding protein|nr:single-stranded DNA-binding protein [Prevotellaceae bacterium]
MTLNKAMIIGNAGKDPEIRHLDNGVSVVTLPVATTERYKDKNGETKEQTEWHNVVFWRQLAEFTEKYVRKGSQLFIEGRLRTRNWEDQSGNKKYVTEIVADNIRLLGRRPDNNNGNGNHNIAAHHVAETKPEEIILDEPSPDDDLPF